MRVCGLLPLGVPLVTYREVIYDFRVTTLFKIIGKSQLLFHSTAYEMPNNRVLLDVCSSKNLHKQAFWKNQETV